MRRIKKLAPAFVLTAALLPACGGSQPTSNPPPVEEHANPPGTEEPTANPPPPEEPMSVNPPGPDGEPGIGDGAGPPSDDDGDDDGDE
ncbi:MAG: hypothetical protein AB7K71_05725 [Polyangiaceae bacterium]